MKPASFMLVAGEPSGDLLAAELVGELRKVLTTARSAATPDFQPLYASLEPRFFGAGGPEMAEAGVDVAIDMTRHSLLGLIDPKGYLKFRRIFRQLFRLALERKPDALICIDYGGFNTRFAHAIKGYARSRADWFHDWDPKIVQYVSPQVWASRESRIWQISRDYDLLLSIFPFEKDWYAKRVPDFRVEFVGHPMVDRHGSVLGTQSAQHATDPPLLVLLPGSRPAELNRHVPVMLEALAIMRRTVPDLQATMVLPNETLAQRIKSFGIPADVAVQHDGLSEVLSRASLAISKTGTITMECAFFGVPTVAIYKAPWASYQVANYIVKIKYASMPNLLAGEETFPEFIQNAATPDNIARAAVEFLRDESRRNKVKCKLAEIISSLGGPGASRRAAQLIVNLLPGPKPPSPVAFPATAPLPEAVLRPA